MKTAGLVLDFYDDLRGALLKETFPSIDDLPEVVKEAHILRPEERDVLRDEAYALVATNEGKVLRKFACIDAGNTLLSALYFEKTAHLLPENVQLAVADRITEAAVEFGLMDKEAAAAAKGANRKRDPMNQPNVSDDADWAQRTNLISIQGTDSSKILDTAAQLKTASVDLSDWEPVLHEEREVTKTAMADGRYPLDSYSDVEQAVSYFDENWVEMNPADRREYAVKTAARADELGIETGPLLARYGSSEYAPDIEAHMANRRAWAPEETHELYTELEKSASEMRPDEFCELLQEIDKVAGVDSLYGGQLFDAYFVTYGGTKEPEVIKSASAEVTDEELQELAAANGLHGVFEFAEDFNKDPVTIYQSLPDDSKAIIAGLAKTAMPINALEAGGLGILAAPSVKTLVSRKSSKKERSHAAFETAGLGVLAAHPVHSIAKKAIEHKGTGASLLKSIGHGLKHAAAETGASDTGGTATASSPESGSPSLSKEAAGFDRARALAGGVKAMAGAAEKAVASGPSASQKAENMKKLVDHFKAKQIAPRLGQNFTKRVQ